MPQPTASSPHDAQQPFRPVLILTRPHPQAASWAQAFATLGVQTMVLPLLDIQAKHDSATRQARNTIVSELGSYHAIMHVSPNAALHFWDSEALQAWQALPPHAATEPANPTPLARAPRLWSPGPGTSQALLSQGFSPAAIDQPDPAHSSQFDSEALWRVVQAGIPGPCRVLIVRGSTISASQAATARPSEPEPAGLIGTGRNWLAHTLEQQGVRVEFLSVYERRAPHWSQADRATALAAAKAPYVWLFNSSEAVLQLTEHFAELDWSSHQAIATHPRIAQTLASKGFVHVTSCLPTAAAIAACLHHAMPNPSSNTCHNPSTD